MTLCLEKKDLRSLGMYVPLETIESIQYTSLNGSDELVNAFIAASERATQLGLGGKFPEKVCLLENPEQLCIKLKGGSSFSYPLTENIDADSEQIHPTPDSNYNNVRRSCI